MESPIIEFFKSFTQLSPGDLLSIYKISKVKRYEEGEVIISEGDRKEYAMGIVKGVIRTYLIKSDGDDVTVRIVREGQFAAASRCLLYGEESTEFLQAIEPCTVVQIDAGKLKGLMKDNIRLLRFWNDNLMKAFDDAIYRIAFFASLTPEERYLDLLKEDRKMVLRVPQKYLASYIGVTTVSLSRIRSRIKNR